MSVYNLTMSDDSDDISEFQQASDSYKEPTSNQKREAPPMALSTKSDDEAPVPGQVSQYALYRGGYTATTPTVPVLPPGIYDITADQNAVYVEPMPDPSGLLLELPEMRSDKVLSIVNTFWASEDDYKIGNKFVHGGAAYKAGIMIFGPPGTGKSCTIKLVSKRLVENGGTVFYASGNPNVAMSFLKQFGTVEKNRKCIVILEDIDSLIHNYGESAYLEMLDSAKSINNVLFIATTNYPDRLDPRLWNRPGRFSHVVKIGLPGPKARKAFLEAILKDHSDVPEIVSMTEAFTIDHLSALINAVYREKKDLQKEAARLRKLFRMPKLEVGADTPSMGIGGPSKVKDTDEDED